MGVDEVIEINVNSVFLWTKYQSEVDDFQYRSSHRPEGIVDETSKCAQIHHRS